MAVARRRRQLPPGHLTRTFEIHRGLTWARTACDRDLPVLIRDGARAACHLLEPHTPLPETA